VVGAAAGAVACNAILGMDAPSLAPPCVDGCAEGGVGDEDGAVTPGMDASTDVGQEASPADGGTDSPVALKDAAPDVELPDGSIRCGGGAYGTSWCVPGVQQCCQTGGTSAPAFACVTTGTCTGYAIECANYDDCSGSEICCRFMQHQVCDVPANCPNSEIVCQTNMSDSCPSGYNCDVPFVGDAAAKSSYLGCSQ
jgi:hypothetical protein